MSTLTVEQVAAVAEAVGLPIANDDLIEVTHRLNIIIADIERIEHPDLEVVDPIPFRPLEEVNNG